MQNYVGRFWNILQPGLSNQESFSQQTDTQTFVTERQYVYPDTPIFIRIKQYPDYESTM